MCITYVKGGTVYYSLLIIFYYIIACNFYVGIIIKSLSLNYYTRIYVGCARTVKFELFQFMLFIKYAIFVYKLVLAQG